MNLGRTQRARAIRTQLLNLVRSGRVDFVAEVADQFTVSRQTIHGHLKWLVDQGMLTASGSTRARIYALGPNQFLQAGYDLGGIDEQTLYQRDFASIFDDLPENIGEICHYGFTEMINNAIDHSAGERALITVERDSESIFIAIDDDGEGIFERIARLMDLPDPRASLLELSKGKLTTDPDHHTGEGIFFTSRAFDRFSIISGELTFDHDHSKRTDVLHHRVGGSPGTLVGMEIELDSRRTLGEVFDQFSSGPDEYRFERTVVPVRLAIYEGERLISRSQAKRLLNRIERFRHVVFDFADVTSIGQAFADEVFRVFQNRHPDIQLVPENMSTDVEKMVKRALSHRP